MVTKSGNIGYRYDEGERPAFDKERVARLGYPTDWLRRCGLNANNMALLPDDKVINMCEALKAFDESARRCKIMFEGKKDQVVNLAKEFLESF